MKESLHSIEDWFNVLKWKHLPNLGLCNTITDFDDFKKSYLICDEIIQFKKNLLTTLTGRFEQHNIRILGRPGCGKTSFIYYLDNATKYEPNSILNDYVFFIMHINRAHGVSDETLIREHIIKAWEKYYIACDKGDAFKRILQQQSPIKETNNALSDYFIKHKGEFKKVLILVIDDADLLEGKEVVAIAKDVIKNLEVASVKKWLIIREITYKGYDIEVRKFVDAFFPDRKDFPKVSVKNVVQHRIQNTSGNIDSKNPFSENLCNLVLERLFDGNMREALSTLKNILEHNSPGDFSKNTDEKVLQKYIDTVAINSLLKLNYLPNLHDPLYRKTFLPLPLDILMLVKHLHSIELIFATLDTVTTIRTDRLKVTNTDTIIKVRDDDFQYTLNRLIELGLIEKEGKAYYLSRKGDLLSDYAGRKHYIDVSKDMTTERDELYWRLVNTIIDHSAIAINILLWS